MRTSEAFGSLPMAKLPSAPARTFGLMAGVRVLDLTTSIAGPYATQLLGDMGADVVKIERPGTGDGVRAWGPPFLAGASLWFLSVNRNKRSVELDYRTTSGLELLRRLLVKADVFVANLRPGILRRLGLDYQRVAADRPEIIYCSITGFGLTGERRDWPAYDLIAEGYSGIMDLTGEAAGDPQKIGAPAADLLAGMDAAMGIIAALFDRLRTGKGHALDVSLLNSMVRFAAPRIVSYLGSGEVFRRSGRDSPIAIYQTFKTADEPMTLGLGNDAIFRRFCAAIGQSEWAEKPAYASNESRRSCREELVALIQDELSRRPRAEWLAVFRSHDVPAGPVNRIDQVAADEELLKSAMFYTAAAADQRVPQVGTGWMLDGSANGCRLPPPALGEHAESVLSEWLDNDAGDRWRPSSKAKTRRRR